MLDPDGKKVDLASGTFWKNAGVGAAVSAVGTGVVVVLGTVAVTAASPVIATGAAVGAVGLGAYGLYQTATTGYEVATQKEAFTGRQLSDKEHTAVAGQLAGGVVGGLGAGRVAKAKLEWKGPADYSTLKDSSSVGPGKNFTQTQKTKIRDLNRQHNGGLLRSDLDGTFLRNPRQSQKGVTPSKNEAHVDHIQARANRGSNSYQNAQILSREQNMRKSDQ